MKILIAAGSSGGHIFPAIATAFKIKESNMKNEIFFLGSKKDLDAQIFKNEGYNFGALSTNKQIFKDILSSFLILKKFKPDIVVGFGGYVSFPALLTAKIMGLPTMIHEQNLIPGLANKVLSKFVDRIAVSFRETNNFLSKRPVIKETGNPIRANLVKLDREKVLERFGLDARKFTILVMGGSQGAHFINEAVLEMLKEMDEARKGNLQLIHLCGLRDFEFVKLKYASLGVENRVFSFFDRMSEAYSSSDLVISRAGATSIAEITFFGLPAILIPYPSAKVHQIENARFLEQNNAAIVIQQKDLSAGYLKEVVYKLMGTYGRLKAMSENAKRLARPQAARMIAEEIVGLWRIRTQQTQ